MSSIPKRPLKIPITNDLFQYSAAGAGSVFCIGFVISVQYYGRVGVGHADVPSLLALSAGISFILLTGFLYASGFAAARAIANPHKSLTILAVVYVALGIVITQYFVFRYGFLTYCGLSFIAGLAGMGRKFFEKNGNHILVHEPLTVAVVLLLLLSGYTQLAYPNLSRALGGAAPKPIHIALVGTMYPHVLNEGDKTYELLKTSEGLYIAIEPFRPIETTKVNSAFEFPRTMPFINGTRFVYFPKESIALVRYMDERQSPPEYIPDRWMIEESDNERARGTPP